MHKNYISKIIFTYLISVNFISLEVVACLVEIHMKSDMAEWIDRRYDILWEAFGDKTFRFEDAAKVLKEKNKDTEEQVPVFLSQLRKAGFLSAESDARDARQKLYRLHSREAKIAEKLGRGDIDALLKRAADLIRTRVDYKFILILLFMKRISDKWEMEFEEAYKEAKADGLSEEDARAEAKRDEYHLFNLPEEYLWENLRKNVSGLTEQFSKALKAIAEQNPELKDIVDSVDFIQFASSRENAETLRQLVELFSEKKLNHVSADVLGDAYEWILRYFAPTKAKEGEIYTPREVIKLLIEILDPKPMESVYDPACGSGGMLIEAFKHVEAKCGFEEAQKLFLFGQEVNQRTIALAKMNMYIHDIRDAHLEFGDTFLYPKFKEGDGIKQFDVVLANPPWNQDGYDEEVLKKAEFYKKRFELRFCPPPKRRLGMDRTHACIRQRQRQQSRHSHRQRLPIPRRQRKNHPHRSPKPKTRPHRNRHTPTRKTILQHRRTRSHHNLQPTQTNRTQRQSTIHKRLQRSRTTPRSTQTKQAMQTPT